MFQASVGGFFLIILKISPSEEGPISDNFCPIVFAEESQIHTDKSRIRLKNADRGGIKGDGSRYRRLAKHQASYSTGVSVSRTMIRPIQIDELRDAEHRRRGYHVECGNQGKG
jgi:hypothetical protein